MHSKLSSYIEKSRAYGKSDPDVIQLRKELIENKITSENDLNKVELIYQLKD